MFQSSQIQKQNHRIFKQIVKYYFRNKYSEPVYAEFALSINISFVLGWLQIGAAMRRDDFFKQKMVKKTQLCDAASTLQNATYLKKYSTK